MTDTLGDIQERLVHHLENVIRLSDETVSLVRTSNRTASDIRKADLQQKIDDVNNLQIRMTILAPMKTGKSTILNAIIGHEILPIHDEAMTALPTEIVLQYSNEQHMIDEPYLCLTEACRDILKEMQESVCTALNRASLDSLDKDLNFNSHLIETAQKLLKRTNYTDWSVEKTTGIENINALLFYINDLVHIFTFLHPCNVLDSDDQSPSRLLGKFFRNIPRVQIRKTIPETSSHGSASSIASRPHRLLLIDTPGPNEEATSERLKEVIEEEIKKADIVLVALDYTTLGTEIDAKIAAAIRKVHDIKDSRYVYAVVNKVDQRQEHGKSPEDVRKHIATKYDIDEGRVFELRARYGLTAIKFLTASNSSLPPEQLSRIKQSTAARNVLRLCYPIDFEYRMQKIELNELRQLAEQLHTISGIPELLTSAIARINGEIIHRCIEAAFRIGYKIYDDLQRDIRLYREYLHHKAEDLEVELRNLRRDQKTVRKIKENFDDNAETKLALSTLKGELQRIFTKVQGMILDDMNTLFSEQNKRWLDPSKWRSYFYKNRLQGMIACGGITAAGGALAFMSALTGIGTVTCGTVGIVVYFHSSGQIEFDKYSEAEKFLDYVIQRTNNISAESYQTVTTEVNAACNDALQNMHHTCLKKINEIMEKVKQRSDRNMEFPQCKVPTFEFNHQRITSGSVPINCRYRPMFGIVPFTFGCERDTQKHTRFQISREELYDKCKKTISDNAAAIINDIDEEVYDMMKKIVTDQVDVFNSLLRKCERHIKDYISEKECNKKDVEEAKQQLDPHQENLEVEKNKFDECCTSFKDCMATMKN